MQLMLLAPFPFHCHIRRYTLTNVTYSEDTEEREYYYWCLNIQFMLMYYLFILSILL